MASESKVSVNKFEFDLLESVNFPKSCGLELYLYYYYAPSPAGHVNVREEGKEPLIQQSGDATNGGMNMGESDMIIGAGKEAYEVEAAVEERRLLGKGYVQIDCGHWP